jgi:hypothetical protein
MRNELLLITLISALAVPCTGRAQSLADVAKAEAARRKAQRAPTKTYTNENLSGTLAGSDVSAAPAPREGAGNGAPAKPVAASTAAPDAKPNAEAPDEKKTEAYWKSRVTALQQSLARNKVLTEAMQSRINALNAEALAVDDPGRHATLQTNLTASAAELQRLKQEGDKQNKDLLALQEEARRANIPPGWLR